MGRWNTLRTVVCQRCNNEFTTYALNCRRCENCRNIHNAEYKDKYYKENRVSGIGSGNAQGLGKNHHTYKSGTGIFRRIKLESLDVFNCERCGEDLSQVIQDKIYGRYFWCVHHKDHNRENNELSNLELLCKRCHQLEHKCIDNLPNN